jgi:hypothetical protein
MKLIFEDGSVQDWLVTGYRQLATGEVVFSPQQPPRSLKLVWFEPPTYANLDFVGCGHVQPGDYVLTTEGLKRVTTVEQDAGQEHLTARRK